MLDAALPAKLVAYLLAAVGLSGVPAMSVLASNGSVTTNTLVPVGAVAISALLLVTVSIRIGRILEGLTRDRAEVNRIKEQQTAGRAQVEAEIRMLSRRLTEVETKRED